MTVPVQSFHHLAIFICHLFVDGHFRTTHIVYDPGSAFDGRLISEIQSTCPHPVPLFITDVTQPFALPWTSNDHTDNILQLIFFDPDNFPADNNDHIKDLFIFYRLFVFPQPIEETEVRHNFGSPILYYTSHSVSVSAHWIPDHLKAGGNGDGEIAGGENQSTFIFPIDRKRASGNIGVRLHDLVFGKYERQWMSASADDGIESAGPVLVHFYFSNSNAPSIAGPVESSDAASQSKAHRCVWPESGRIYKRLSTEYQPIGTKQLNKLDGSKSTNPSFDLVSTPNMNRRTTPPISLFNYRANELRMIIVYGTDQSSDRGVLTLFTFKSSQAVWLYLVTSTTILCIIRRKLKLRHDGLISSLIDFVIGYFGGGRLRITHRIEKWFFACSLMAALFLHAIFGSLMFNIIWLNPKNIVESFDEVTTMNLPIFLSPTLQDNEQFIKTILSDKMGENHRYLGIKPFLELFNNHDKAFAYVVEEPLVKFLQAMAKNFRDVNLIEESLGTVNSRSFLVSDQHIPTRLMEKLHERITWMMAGGIYQFYDTLGAHLTNLREEQTYNDENEDDAFPPITMRQFKAIIALCSVIIFSSCIIFFVEWIKFYLNNRRNRRIMSQPALHPCPHLLHRPHTI